MAQALVHEGEARVVQVVPDGGEFPVAPGFRWVTAPPECEVGWGFDGASVAPPPPPPSPPLEEARALALLEVDQAAGAARARYITTAPGQEAVYMLKLEQARAYQAAGYAGAVPELIQAEADALGVTAQEAADLILATAAAWTAKAAQIERIRRGRKAEIEAAADVAAIEAARQAAITELAAV